MFDTLMWEVGFIFILAFPNGATLFYPQLPIGEAKTFKGLIDLVTKEQIIWKPTSSSDDGKVFEQKPLTETDDPVLLKEAKDARNALIEQVKF